MSACVHSLVSLTCSHGSALHVCLRMLMHSVSDMLSFSQDAMNVRVVMVAPDVGLREFTFDGVLSGERGV